MEQVPPSFEIDQPKKRYPARKFGSAKTMVRIVWLNEIWVAYDRELVVEIMRKTYGIGVSPNTARREISEVPIEPIPDRRVRHLQPSKMNPRGTCRRSHTGYQDTNIRALQHSASDETEPVPPARRGICGNWVYGNPFGRKGNACSADFQNDTASRWSHATSNIHFALPCCHRVKRRTKNEPRLRCA